MARIVSFRKTHTAGFLFFWNRVFEQRPRYYFLTERTFSGRVLNLREFNQSRLLLLRQGKAIVGACHSAKLNGKGYIAFLHVLEGWEDEKAALLNAAEIFLMPVSEICFADSRMPFYAYNEAFRQPFWGSSRHLALETEDLKTIESMGKAGYAPSEYMTTLACMGLKHYDEDNFAVLERGMRLEYYKGQKIWNCPFVFFDRSRAWEVFGKTPYNNIRAIFLMKGERTAGFGAWYSMKERSYACIAEISIQDEFLNTGAEEILLEAAMNDIHNEGFRNIETTVDPADNSPVYTACLRKGFRINSRWVSLKKRMQV